MILLELRNRIVEESVLARFTAEKQSSVDITLADFDGVKFHISSDADAKNLITVSVSWTAIPELMRYGANEHLRAVYGSHLRPSPEAGYDVSLTFDLNSPPSNPADFAARVGLLKRHLLSAPFKTVFEAIDKGQASTLPPMIVVPYRDQECFYIKPSADQCTVIFSVFFRDPNDQVYSKVFLQEFADARKTMRNVPAVSFSQKEVPLELQGVSGVDASEHLGFVSFVLFKGHISDKQREKSIDTLQTFRDYLHYHIKCSKANLHDRMRRRVATLLQILNRAKMDVEKKKKTMSGRTFTAS